MATSDRYLMKIVKFCGLLRDGLLLLKFLAFSNGFQDEV